MNKLNTKSVTVTNTLRYADGTASHMLSYCAWSGIKIAVSCMFNKFPLLHNMVHSSEHPALTNSIRLEQWATMWPRIEASGTAQEKYIAILAVLKQLNILELGSEACVPPSTEILGDICVTIGADILPMLRYAKAMQLPTAKTNSNLSLANLVESVALSLTGRKQSTMKLEWEEDLDRIVSKLMKEVTTGKVKPAKLAQWCTEMLKAYSPSTHAQRELVAECITKKYCDISLDEYKWAIEYLRLNLPLTVVDVTTSATTRSIQASTIIQYLSEKLTMVESEVGMFSLVDMDILPTKKTDVPAASETTTGKTITIAAPVAFDAVAYAQWPVLQPSGLAYPSELHRKVAFMQYCRTLPATPDTKDGE